jgi:GPH family glycoside/pentoside/hexuronide:cation symporter
MDASQNNVDKMPNLVKWPERISYAASDFACNLSFGMISNFLMFFYTDTFGISAAAVGTLFFVARFFDAVDGPIWGILIDHTHTRFGKSRPYWLWFSIPFAVLLCVSFHHTKLKFNR